MVTHSYVNMVRNTSVLNDVWNWHASVRCNEWVHSCNHSIDHHSSMLASSICLS